MSKEPPPVGTLLFEKIDLNDFDEFNNELKLRHIKPTSLPKSATKTVIALFMSIDRIKALFDNVKNKYPILSDIEVLQKIINKFLELYPIFYVDINDKWANMARLIKWFKENYDEEKFNEIMDIIDAQF